MLGGLVGKDLDVVLLSCIDVYQGLADGELVLSNGKVELSYLEGGRELLALPTELSGAGVSLVFLQPVNIIAIAATLTRKKRNFFIMLCFEIG